MKLTRIAITLILVLLAIIAIFKAWVFLHRITLDA